MDETKRLLSEFSAGRTDVVFDLLDSGVAANYQDEDQVSLLQTCAYHGDVSAIRLLLTKGESLSTLGPNLGLSGASFHGHWRLCQLLLERGADVNAPDPETGETALHSCLCTADRAAHDVVLRVLLVHGADPNRATIPGIETGGFMRDCRTRGETALHRAAAFGGRETIQLLLDAGARKDARDRNGDTPLSWASWHLRDSDILRPLCYGEFRVRPQSRNMRSNLIGEPVGN